MTRKACKGENGFAWMAFKKLVKALKHFNELGFAGFHESYDFVVFKSVTSDKLVELMAVIFYCR